MKIYSKVKTICAFLLTMVMFTSLFLFSGCSDDEKFLFKIIYRPYASEGYGFFSSYKDALLDEMEFLSTEVITHMVGTFGMGKIEHNLKNGKKAEDLSPNLGKDEYGYTSDYEDYYYNLVGLSPYMSDKDLYYEMLGKLTSCDNFLYLEQINGIGTKIVEDGDDTREERDYDDYPVKLLVLSNTSFDKQFVESLISYDDDDKSFSPNATLIGLDDGKSYTYRNTTYLMGNSGYYCDYGWESYFIFIGDYSYRDNDWTACLWSSKESSFDGVVDAERFISKIISTNFNSIQQTVYQVLIWGSDVEYSDINRLDYKSWNYSLTEKEMGSVYDAQSYLDSYLYKFQRTFEVEIAKIILTRGGSELFVTDSDGNILDDSLLKKYDAASKNNATTKEIQAFINDACEYIDHLGLIEDEIEGLKEFILETVAGYEITDINKNIEKACDSMLEDLVEEVGYAPLLEVLNYKASELDEIKIDGYIQSIIFLKEEDSYEFTDFLCFFDTDNFEGEIIPYELTIRYMAYGEMQEYQIPVPEEDVKQGAFAVSVADAGEEGLKYVELMATKDPITVNPFSLELITRQVKILNRAEEYASKFVYSTSTKNTSGYAWCFDDENCDYVQVVFGLNSLCINQHLDLLLIGF